MTVRDIVLQSLESSSEPRPLGRDHMRKESLEFLKTLVSAPLPSGFERGAQEIWMKYAKEFADETRYDPYGNAIAILNPKGKPRLMVMGHGDAIGMIITYISDSGYLYYETVGGIDPMSLVSQRVMIHGKKGIVHGVIGRKAIHMILPEDRTKAPKHEDMWIDIGAKDRKDAEKLVAVGDYGQSIGDFLELKNSIAIGSRFDNKVGTWSAIETLRLLKGLKIDACVIAVSSVQEECTGAGASTAAFHLEPDCAVVVDVTHTTDHPGTQKEKYGDVKLGGGPVLELGPPIHPIVRDGLSEAAKKAKIKIQCAAQGGFTRTDADSIFKSRGGIPTAGLSVPNRYMHTTVEAIHLGDLDKVPQVIAAYAKTLKKTTKFY